MMRRLRMIVCGLFGHPFPVTTFAAGYPTECTEPERRCSNCGESVLWGD